jgi:hypothetical protein
MYNHVFKYSIYVPETCITGISIDLFIVDWQEYEQK